jgi:hypothetical protein
MTRMNTEEVLLIFMYEYTFYGKRYQLNTMVTQDAIHWYQNKMLNILLPWYNFQIYIWIKVRNTTYAIQQKEMQYSKVNTSINAMQELTRLKF